MDFILSEEDEMLNRRQFGLGLAVGTGALVSPAYLRRATTQIAGGINPFAFSVASGDPLANAVIIWTRLARAVNDPTPLSDTAIAVEWMVAADERLAQVVRRGIAMALPENGHSVHVDVEGLEADRPYWYGFRVGGTDSPVGRTRTLADPLSAPASVRFNVVSCQHWENGYFDAYDGMKDDDAAFVLHLGDYFYEVGRGGVRQHESTKVPATLAEFRARHSLYKTDAALRRAHESMPFVGVLDNHDALEFDSSDPQELRRRAAAYQAWYEFMPTRMAAGAMNPAMPIVRELNVGHLLRLVVPDTRQFRASHDICGAGSDPAFAFGVYRKPCSDVESAQRSMLGRAQEVWLEDRLKNSAATWTAIGTTVPMTPLDMKHGGELYRYLASWAGYPANRARILDWIQQHKVANPISVSGDIHSSLVSTVVRNAGDSPDRGVMTEFVGTSISSVWPAPLAQPMADAMSANPHVAHYDPSRRGYLRCTVTPRTWTADLRTIDFTDKPGGKTTTERSFVVESGRIGAQTA
jgi:alkaline phosphatase D